MMLFRAFVLLFAVVGLSVAATLYFGQDVLIALGMILVQIKIIAKKLVSVELPVVLVWLKTQTALFFRVELLKKWIMTTLLPLLLGSAALRRIAAYLGKYRKSIDVRYRRMIEWYSGLHWAEKIVAALIILFATIALSVSSLGLWLILFSVKLPLWIAAAATALARMTIISVQKMTFKAIAFLQLKWLWRLSKKVLPAAWLERKRKFDYRIARAVIRRRRMTIKQLAKRKDSLSFRMGLMMDYLTGKRSERK